MYNRLVKFLEENKLLFSNQFGFRSSHSRSSHSTTNVIVLIVDKIQRAIERKEFSCGIFLDLSKAFDTVEKKLEYYGVRGIAKDWFCSYLSNRKQFVSVGNYKSEMSSIACDVPQGSVLGPLLFLLYINDFNSSAEGIEFHLFADDSNLFYSHKNLHSLEEKLNHEFININEWLRANKLSLNVEKSNFVIFHPHQKKSPFPLISKYAISILKKKKCFKYLGIFIKSNNSPTKKTVRIITFSHFQSHTSPIFKKLNLLKLSDIVKLHTILFMHQYYNDRLPKAFNDFFCLVKHKHRYNTRLASKIAYTLPLIHTNHGLHSLRFYGPKLWNSVDEELKTLSVSSIKSKLQLRFISEY